MKGEFATFVDRLWKHRFAVSFVASKDVQRNPRKTVKKDLNLHGRQWKKWYKTQQREERGW